MEQPLPAFGQHCLDDLRRPYFGERDETQRAWNRRNALQTTSTLARR